MADIQDFDNVIGGPATLKVTGLNGGDRFSHTSGGVSVKVAPQTRMRTVDAFGDSPVAVIGKGDKATMELNLAESQTTAFEYIVAAGVDGGTYQGFGRSAGYVYTAAAHNVVPLLAADSAKKVLFHRGVNIGELNMGHNNEGDRLYAVNVVGLVKEDETDGELIGKILLS